MQSFVRRHTVGVSGVVSALALAVVVAAVRGVIPASALPTYDPLVSVIPSLNALISATAIVTIALGWRATRNRDFTKHRALMGTSTLLFAGFLAFYLYRLTVHGTTEFGGPDAVYQFLYLPILIVHMALAMVCIPLVVYALVLASTHAVTELPGTPHARVGRVAASLWMVSFFLGIVVYLLLYVVY